ncbi:MAG: hypothetical protein NVSMB65_15830 [Chloroflexota bacterium]
MPVHNHVVCPYCALLCDDLTVEVDGDTVVGCTGCGTAAERYIGAARERPDPILEGRPASLDDAVERAAALLAGARRPLVLVLGHQSSEAAGVAAALAAATTPDVAQLASIQQGLANQNLLPQEHLVDAGYVDADHLVTSRAVHGIDLVGPAPVNQNWQARAAQGFDVRCFALDWDTKTATCPTGRTSVKWCPTHDRHGNAIINIEFATADCRACEDRPRCTRAVREPRGITIRPRPAYEALRAAQDRQTTAAFKEQYAARAGVEGTISQGTRVCGLRRARYIGRAKTHFQHVLTAVALNVRRVLAWEAETPLARTRTAAFARLPAVA